MKVPEKIHIQPNARDRWFEGNIPNGLPNGLFIEYIHKDVFINKACEWIKYNNENGGCLFDGWEENFKKYIEE